MYGLSPATLGAGPLSLDPQRRTILRTPTPQKPSLPYSSAPRHCDQSAFPPPPMADCSSSAQVQICAPSSAPLEGAEEEAGEGGTDGKPGKNSCQRHPTTHDRDEPVFPTLSVLPDSELSTRGSLDLDSASSSPESSPVLCPKVVPHQPSAFQPLISLGESALGKRSRTDFELPSEEEAKARVIASSIRVAELLCARFGGEVAERRPVPGRGGKPGLKLNCSNGHSFHVAIDKFGAVAGALKTGKAEQFWCGKCENYYRKCQEFAAGRGGKVESRLFDAAVVISCARGHSQRISYNRNLSQIACPDCKREDRQQQKQAAQMEFEQQQDESARKQQQLFEEARKKLHSEIKDGTHPHYQFHCEQVMRDVCRYAQRKAGEFMSSSEFDGSLSEAMIVHVYKISFTPMDVLVGSLRAMKPEILISNFRKLARILHPDKNSHPLAKEAFQKLSEAYNLAR